MTEEATVLSESNELEQFFSDGGTLGMLNDMSSDTLEQIYALAFTQYQAGKWQDAHKLFQLLCVLDHYDARFCLGLGACRQSLAQWEEAIQSYSYGALLDVKDPRFPFHAAECHLQMENLEAAESGFYSAEALATQVPSYAVLAARAGVMKETVILKRSKIDGESDK